MKLEEIFLLKIYLNMPLWFHIFLHLNRILMFKCLKCYLLSSQWRLQKLFLKLYWKKDFLRLFHKFTCRNLFWIFSKLYWLPKQKILSKSIILEQKKQFPLLLENFYCYIQYSAFIVKQEAKLINQKEYNQR